ncbi:hypothetical protein Tco_1184946 [Tanacetum coccineum]
MCYLDIPTTSVGIRSSRRNEGEESENPFFEGDGSSLFAELEEWEEDVVVDDNYEEAPIFDDDQYEDVIEEEEGFVENYPNFQEDENNVLFSGVVLGVEVESMPVYDTDIEDVIKEEEGFAVENVVENESHFSLEVVDQDLSPLAMFTIHLMCEQGKRVVGSQWQKRWELRWWRWQAMWMERKRCWFYLRSRRGKSRKIVVERLLEKLVELPMCSPMVERRVDREEKKFLD